MATNLRPGFGILIFQTSIMNSMLIAKKDLPEVKPLGL